MKSIQLTLLLAVWLCPLAAAQPAAKMVPVATGHYVPLYASDGQEDGVEVEAFYLSKFAVTNEEFLAFVRANPDWRRSAVKRLFADKSYLTHWAGDLELGPEAPANHPVVYVSWFAARAYADWVGMRIPTTAEWEYAAAAGRSSPDARSEAGFREGVMRRYSARSGSMLQPVGSTDSNHWGVAGLHANVWEWVDDFNSSMVTGESRNNTDLDRGLFCGGASLGASDITDYAAFIRFALRSGLAADFTLSKLGFRVAADGPQSLSAGARRNEESSR